MTTCLFQPTTPDVHANVLHSVQGSLSLLRAKKINAPDQFYPGDWLSRSASTKRALQQDIEAREFLVQAIALSQGEAVAHAFWGRVAPDDAFAIGQFRGMLEAYIKQADAGMCCLLAEYMGTVKALAAQFASVHKLSQSPAT